MSSRFDPLLEELLADDFVVASYTGDDLYGNPQYGAPETIKGYVEDNQARGDPPDNQATFGPKVAFAGKLWCKPDKLLNPRDKLTLPSGHTAYVLAVTVYRNVPEPGPHHQEIDYTTRR